MGDSVGRPVPTDVETGPDQNLDVTTLPGGPEGPDSGNPGSAHQIDRWGHPHRIATGFHSATNLAIDNHGRIFVAELGSGTISQVEHGMPKVVLSLLGVKGSSTPAVGSTPRPHPR